MHRRVEASSINARGHFCVGIVWRKHLNRLGPPIISKRLNVERVFTTLLATQESIIDASEIDKSD